MCSIIVSSNEKREGVEVAHCCLLLLRLLPKGTLVKHRSVLFLRHARQARREILHRAGTIMLAGNSHLRVYRERRAEATQRSTIILPPRMLCFYLLCASTNTPSNKSGTRRVGSDPKPAGRRGTSGCVWYTPCRPAIPRPSRAYQT
ncbi:unnamed protein product [Ectocarpus sp. 13 AM-2016]